MCAHGLGQGGGGAAAAADAVGGVGCAAAGDRHRLHEDQGQRLVVVGACRAAVEHGQAVRRIIMLHLIEVVFTSSYNIEL